ncbi:MAG: pantoate--beta-alanine ligase [Desulfobulbaceae bacterium]|jgi:pantoate--beta-alanine ligase|nr:pantoate--beta-alanine ligase [Desulfobulbaceae bacterium]MDH3775511.1 pantoate--beta-alanine ligase [Desulfobulbaceae bacterium]MDH3781424.1 pantoate--beta-alanine ligase [Desulfobulbaceae bacterium]MDH3866649.1 pantoate--beta-alanine ligase [Desulfobulbaceae bacterium]HKJ15086.1 pantoate--beta-alanine ligase [Desulfobulbales bacterium]
MQIIHHLADMTRWSNEVIAGGKALALVPTMGYFHAGHLSLMRQAGRLADHVVVSLFVNSLQFGPREDLSRYPRDLQRDARLAENEKVDILFVPTSEEMYAPDFNTRVRVNGITDTLCGQQRPTHFEGVTTVVAKLFNIIKPHCAVFGQKDFQQLSVIRKMVRELNWDIEIFAHPIVREDDGLAMSSRNTYLSSEERSKALCLNKAIQHAKARFADGLDDSDLLISEIRDIISANSGVSIDYISVVDKDTLSDKEVIDSQSVLALAIKVGGTRLIDNCFMGSDSQISN